MAMARPGEVAFAMTVSLISWMNEWVVSTVGTAALNGRYVSGNRLALWLELHDGFSPPACRSCLSGHAN
jgi:hypothetical protein